MTSMKTIALITFTLVATAHAALSTIRVGPRRQLRNTEFEFGRPAPVDEEEPKRALQELTFAQNHRLQSESYYPHPTMSMPLMGFSLPYSTFSLPYSTMSMQTNTPYTATMTTHTLSNTPTHTPTQTTTHNHHLPCVMPDLTNSPSVDITIALEVETLTGTTNFLDPLAHASVSVVSSSFSLCTMSSRTRLLAIRSLTQTKTTGLLANDNTRVVEEKTCTPSTDGASCSVVNIGLTVYANDNNSTTEAGQQVTKELQDQIEDGRLIELLHSDYVVALRIVQANSGPSGNVSAAEGGKATPRGFPSATVRSTTIAILSVALLAAVGLVVYKTTHPNDTVDGDVGSASCDESSISGTTGDHSDLSILNDSFHLNSGSV